VVVLMLILYKHTFIKINVYYLIQMVVAAARCKFSSYRKNSRHYNSHDIDILRKYTCIGGYILTSCSKVLRTLSLFLDTASLKLKVERRRAGRSWLRRLLSLRFIINFNDFAH